MSRPISANAAGALWMLAGAFVLTVQGALVKHISDDLPVIVILFIRTILVVALVLPWTMRQGGMPNLYTRRLGTHFLRTIFGLGMLAGNFYAVSVLTLSDAIALSFTRPIWSMFTSFIMLGEVVGWAGAAATMAGFGGVLVIVQPQTGIHPGVFIALAGAASSSFALIFVKRLTTTEPLERILFYFALFSCVILGLPAFLYWQTPTPVQFVWLLGVAITGALGQYLTGQAVKAADVTVVTPVDFSRVPIAALVGYVVFSEAPTIWTFIGTAIILCATLVILRLRSRPARLEALSKTHDADR